MYRTDLTFHGRVLSVASDGPQAQDVLGRLFAPYVVRGGHSRPSDILVSSGPDGWSIEWDRTVVAAAAGDLAPELEHVVTQAMLKSLPDFLHMHGAAVAGRDGAVVALGASGAGKSTVATLWSLAGRSVLGDDVVLLDRSGLLHPLKKPLKLDAARSADLSLALDETVLWEPGSAEAWVDPAAHGGWADPMPVVALVLLDRTSAPADDEGGVDLTPLPVPEGLQVVLSQLMNTGGRGADWIDSVLELVKRAGVRRLSFRDSRRAAERLAALAGSPR